MRINTAFAAVLVLTGLALQVPASAESEPRADLRLTVVDAANAALPAAMVTIYTTDGRPGIDLTADAKGVVALPSLPVGFVQIYARYPGHTAYAEAATLTDGPNVLTVTLPRKDSHGHDDYNVGS
jgi:hypothetical protein